MIVRVDEPYLLSAESPKFGCDVCHDSCSGTSFHCVQCQTDRCILNHFFDFKLLFSFLILCCLQLSEVSDQSGRQGLLVRQNGCQICGSACVLLQHLRLH
jgi:hypothetical protein